MAGRELPISVHDDEGITSVHGDKNGPATTIPSRNVWETVYGVVKFSIVVVIGVVVGVVSAVLMVPYGIYAFLLPEKVRYIVRKSLKYALAVVGYFLLLVVGVVFILLYPFAYTASRWKGIFILSCLAVSFDSLFLYIPIIDEEHNCLGTDMPLRNVALALRSVTDLTFIFHITCLICGLMNKCPNWSDSGLNLDPKRLSDSSKLKHVREAMTKKISGLSFSVIINFVAILPFPQLAVIVGFFRMGSFYRSQIMNKVLVCQYILRSCQIILSIKKMHTAGKWFKGASYFLLYFIASHVLGAFWYFFAIQLKLSCWDEACQTIAGCMSVYNCGHNTSLNSTYMLSESCPIDASNATAFDFGMYSDVLKSGNMGHTDFSAKFFYYFWWSLKNLSNFGTNLNTSSNMWENCFAIIICAMGLLLFIILIGNVQTYIQSETEKSLMIKDKRRMRLYTKYKDIEKWLSTHGYPDNDLETPNAWKNIKELKVVEFIDKDVDLEFMRNCYKRRPSATDPLNVICVHALKKVTILRDVDEQDLTNFHDAPLDCTTLEKDSCIIEAGKQLNSLYLIIDGTIEDVKTKRRRDCCGEEVLHWAISNYKNSKEKRDSLPNATVDLKCLTKIGAFKFTADALIDILKEFKKPQQLPSALDHQISTTERGMKDWLLRNEFPEDLKANIMKLLPRGNTNGDADVDVDIKNLLPQGNMNADDVGVSINTDAGIKNLLPLRNMNADVDAHADDVGVNVDVNADVDVDVAFLFRILPENMKPSIRRHLGMNALKNVAVLQKMHEYVLEIICNYLQPVVYKMNCDVNVRAGEPLGFMIFILGGKVIFTDTSSSNVTTTNSSDITKPSEENVLERGDYYGDQLLSWASPNNVSSSDMPVISTRDFKCQTKVEALILKAKDLKSVAYKCGSQWNFDNCMNSQQLVHDGRDRVANAAPTPTIEEAIRLHQGNDIILEQLVLLRDTIFGKLDDQGQKLDDQGRRLDDMAAYLTTVGYTGSTHTSSTPPAP